MSTRHIVIGFVLLILTGCDSHRLLTFFPFGKDSEWANDKIYVGGSILNRSTLFVAIKSSEAFTDQFQLVPQKTNIQIGDEKPISVEAIADILCEKASDFEYRVTFRRLRRLAEMLENTDGKDVYVIFEFVDQQKELNLKFMVRADE